MTQGIADNEVWQYWNTNKKYDFLLREGHLADCSFIINDDDVGDAIEFKCHKLILCLASPAFERMFYGHYKESKSSMGIPLTDVKRKIFKWFLEYIYNGKLEYLNDIPTNSLMDLIKLAHLYLVEPLVVSCCDVIKRRLPSVNHFNLIILFEFAYIMDQKSLIEMCTKYIKVAAKITPNTKKPLGVDCHYCGRSNFVQIDKYTTTERITDCPRIYSLKPYIFYEFLKLLIGIVTERALFNLIELYSQLNREIIPRTNVVRTKIEENGKLKVKEVKANDDSVDKIEVRDNQGNIKSDESITICMEVMLELIDFNNMTADEFHNGPSESSLLKYVTQDISKFK